MGVDGRSEQTRQCSSSFYEALIGLLFLTVCDVAENMSYKRMFLNFFKIYSEAGIRRFVC